MPRRNAMSLTLAWIALSSPAFAGDRAVSEAGRAFAPAEMAAAAGDRLVFNNDDKVSHQVVVRGPGGTITLPARKSGEQSVTVLPSTGTFMVGCAFHPGMRMTVTVR